MDTDEVTLSPIPMLLLEPATCSKLTKQMIFPKRLNYCYTVLEHLYFTMYVCELSLVG